MKTRSKRTAPRARGGFTLVELMVAVLLLGVGLSGLVATSGAISRMMGGSIRESTASTIAASRFEKLRGTACASIVSGSATKFGVTESWTVIKTGRSYLVTDSLSYVPISRRSTVKQAYRSYVTC
jgi:prepilin-type N-terminal cleavage/methylation domain-containing protein